MNNKQIDIDKILDSATPEILKAVTERLKTEVTDSLTWSANHAIKEKVEVFVKEQILPDLDKILLDQKSEIMNGLKDLSAKLGAKVAEGLLANAVKNIQNSYTIGEIAKTLFN